MVIQTKTMFWLNKEDYVFIRNQMKQKKIKVKKFCADYQISRTHFYAMGTGKLEAKKLLVALAYEEIYLPYSIGGDWRVEWE